MREVMNISWKRSDRADRGTYAVYREVQAPEVVILLLGDLEHAGSVVEDCASGVLVRVKGIGGEEDEGGASVGDAGGLSEDGRVVGIPDRLVDADVVRRRGCSSERSMPENTCVNKFISRARKTTRYTQSVEIADESGGVRAAKSQETIGRRHVRRRLEGDAKGLRADHALLERVVQHRRDDLSIGDSSLSQPGGTNPDEGNG